MDFIKQIEELDKLQSESNKGRGIDHIRYVIKLLRGGEYNHAMHIARYENDKLSAHPEIKKHLLIMFPEWQKEQNDINKKMGWNKE